MQYQRRSFTIAVSDGGYGAMCLEKGHSAADSRGRCLCCGAKIVEAESFPFPVVRAEYNGREVRFVESAD